MAEEEKKILKYSRKKSESKPKKIGLLASGNFKAVKMEKKERQEKKDLVNKQVEI